MKRLRRYDTSFKKEAVNLVLSTKSSIPKVASDLGIPESTLSTWITNHKLGRINISDKSSLSPQEIALKKAFKELSIVKEERDILKKALGIFSLPKNK